LSALLTDDAGERQVVHPLHAGSMMPKKKLNERTAKCERCGCTWEKACPGGCAWNSTQWARGHAVCTACEPDLARMLDSIFG
jgi:hypothetical protein